MKKLAALSVLAALVSTSAYAKTEGNYVDISVLRSSMKLKENDSFNKDTDSSFGFGTSYKYAVNFNNFFIAPGVFFDRLGSESKQSSAIAGTEDVPVSSSSTGEISLNNRYGVKLDVGYDVNEQFAFYGTGGLSYVSYKVKNSAGQADLTADPVVASSVSASKSGRDSSPFIGAGFVYKINKDFALMTEYTMQNLSLKTGSASVGGDLPLALSSSNAKVKLNILRVGVAYHF